MFEQLSTFLHEQFQTNQFLAGGALLGFAAAILHRTRTVPNALWRFIQRRFMVEVEIANSDETYRWIVEWLARHPYSNKAKNLAARSQRFDDDSTQPRIILTPANGKHVFFYKGRLVYLFRQREGDKNASSNSLEVRETFTIRIFTRSRQLLNDLLEEAREIVHPKNDRRLRIMTLRHGDWHVGAHQRSRSADSVILGEGVMETLLARIGTFLQSEQWYIDRGLPWRYGVLLYGPPGSGKTSSVIATASEFGYDIAILSLSGKFDDAQLMHALNAIPPKTIVLIEDVDCAFQNRNGETGVTMSGLLNAIDGVSSKDGRILFMTTNHIERLDPALIRPGRADLKLEIGDPTFDQARRLCQRFFPSATTAQIHEFAHQLPRTSMATLQCHLLVHRTIEDAIRNIADTQVTIKEAA